MDAHEPDATEPQPDELAGFRQAALVVGALAACSVFLTQMAWWPIQEALLLVTNRPATTTAGATAGALGELLWFVGTRVLPLLAILLAFYLTAGRDLPAAPVAAGAFVGSLVAPIGFVLGATFLRPVDATLLGADALFRFATLTLGFVVPPLLAALLGGAMDDLWKRGARLRPGRS